MALVERCADDRITSSARAVLTTIGSRTGVATTAGAAVLRVWIRAGSRGGVACAGRMTLIGGCTGDRVTADADSSQAGIGLRTRIAVAAGRSVHCVRIGAHPGQRVARAGDV